MGPAHSRGFFACFVFPRIDARRAGTAFSLCGLIAVSLPRNMSRLPGKNPISFRSSYKLSPAYLPAHPVDFKPIERMMADKAMEFAL
jgi:hypothetical protein